MHKFKIGQTVRFEPNTWHFRNSLPGSYEVRKQLPERNSEFEYHVKSSNEAHERVATESQISRAVRLAMRRVVSLFLPTWSTDRVRRNLGSAAPPAETPLVLIGRDGRRRVVLAADAAAQRAGLRIGMPVTKAQALVPGLIVDNADPAGDAEALDRLALWALRLYAPIAAADPPDGLVIDTAGAAHLHGGEDAMAEAMIARLTASGFTACVAIADSWSAAYAFAVMPPSRLLSFRRAKARKPFSICPSRLFVCPRIWWRAFACSASSVSASWRTNRARRSRFASAPSWRMSRHRYSLPASTCRWARIRPLFTQVIADFSSTS